MMAQEFGQLIKWPHREIIWKICQIALKLYSSKNNMYCSEISLRLLPQDIFIEASSYIYNEFHTSVWLLFTGR